MHNSIIKQVAHCDRNDGSWQNGIVAHSHRTDGSFGCRLFKDFNHLMDMAQASGTLEKLNEIYDREMEYMQGAIDDLKAQLKTWKNKIQQYDKFLNVKGLVEEFKEFVRPKSIKERMEDKQKRVETQKKQTVMKHVSRRKEDIAI